MKQTNVRHAKGLDPICTETSRILILGTIPSEKSEVKGEYYTNGSNKFWKIIYSYLNLTVDIDYNEKVQTLKKHNIAVWDLIEECDIIGSKNRTIDKPKYNDLQKLLGETNIELILLNGKDTFKIFEKNYKGITIPYKMVPSTSRAANGYFDIKPWYEAFKSMKI